ncbi:MAG: hypothetical protein RBR35_07730 [Salinivirgaceae bacterium]|nr:hypothetical protein [Salinivirgaceae bacterium]
MTRWIILTLIIGLHCSLFGQMSLREVDPMLVSQKKVRKYVAGFEKLNLTHFCDLESSTNMEFSPDAYSCHIGTFDFEAPLKNIWQTCLTTNPNDLWDGKILSISFIYNKIIDNLLYKKDLDEYELQCGQIYFINLRLLNGAFNLPTALKVTRIDTTENLIEFSYLKGGKSEGGQVLRFTQKSEKQTTLVHTTHYKSGSHWRDKRLYPHFHQKAIDELHRNIAKKTLEQIQNKLN